MNFLSNLADSIPVVGHVKGAVHYAVGDSEAGNKAMYQATRTSAVLGAGAVGALAGPGGAVAAGMYAGVLTDGVASIAMDKPQGFVKGCKNIAEDLKDGKNPTASIASTGFQIGMDGLGGLGMGGVSSAASQVSEKAVVKGVENIAKSAVKTVGEKTVQKTLKMTGEEVVKEVTKTVTEKAVKKIIETAAVNAEIALVSTHVCIHADENTKEEEREKHDREERDREARQRRDRERREREERQREEREQQERRAREQQEQRATEQQEERAREQQERTATEQQQQRPREQQECHGTPERNSGSSQPPRRNRDNNKQSGKNKTKYFDIFMNLLEDILKVIFADVETKTIQTKISQIFEGLTQGQIQYLEKIIRRLQKDEILEEVLTLVIRIFSQHFPESISFLNFLSLMEFVAVYIKEEIDYRTEVFRMAEEISRKSDRSIPKMTFKDLRATIVSSIMNLTDIVSLLVDMFVRLRFDIETELESYNLSPNFRDIFSAIYHYFKHRCVPGDGVLSVIEYYYWIRRVLEELERQQNYIDLLQVQILTGDVRETVIFEIYVGVFGRRIRIVIKFQGGTIVLASCYVLDNTNDDDEEGMVWWIAPN